MFNTKSADLYPDVLRRVTAIVEVDGRVDAAARFAFLNLPNALSFTPNWIFVPRTS